jgi:hypothetical protein
VIGRPDLACLVAAVLLTVIDPATAARHAAQHAICEAAKGIPFVAGHVDCRAQPHLSLGRPEPDGRRRARP